MQVCDDRSQDAIGIYNYPVYLIRGMGNFTLTFQSTKMDAMSLVSPITAWKLPSVPEL